MLHELSLLVNASAAGISYEDLRRLVREENVCLKKTDSTRRETFRRLRELYSLHPDCILYRALRDLWPADERERPLLAFLCASARDPLLRATAPAVLDQPEGAVVKPQMLEAALQESYPDHYSPITRATVGRHAISSWAQAGHLSGRTSKIRARPFAGPVSAAYALLLGHLCGARGALLFETFWIRALDIPPGNADSLAFAASQRGWIDYRRMGDITDISFSFLTREGR
jgi:hypothetical protein